MKFKFSLYFTILNSNLNPWYFVILYAFAYFCHYFIEFVKTSLQSFRIFIFPSCKYKSAWSHVSFNYPVTLLHCHIFSMLDVSLLSLWTTLMFGCATDYTPASPMAYSSSDDDEDFLRSFFHAQFTSLFAPQTSQTELLIRSCGDPERLDRWEQIAPFFRMLR